MANFLSFIEEDITAKKTLLSAMPTRTKTNIKKFNEKIDDFLVLYSNYQDSTQKYLVAKSKSLEIKKDNSKLDYLEKTVNNLEQIRLLLNPTNTYIEKMGFDTLLFDINNYSDFNFKTMNDIINNFIIKFEEAGFKLDCHDFNYTFYVNKYMTLFLEVRLSKSPNYDELSWVFEEIYWENPELIEHIELNFRRLIRINKKKLVAYIDELKKKAMWENNVANYQDCLDKLKFAYFELKEAQDEEISDIINLSKNGEIEITNFEKESKVRISNYEGMMIEKVDFNNKETMEKFHSNLKKLKLNIEEYISYLDLKPLFKDFKTEYEKQLSEIDNKSSKDSHSGLKEIKTKITKLESKLIRLNKKVFTGKLNFLDFKKGISSRQLKLDSLVLAKELYELYKQYDLEVFKRKVLTILNKVATVPELLNLYYSYDYFKKKTLEKVFKLTSYQEVIKKGEAFNLFASNPNNIIINGVPLFEENNIAEVIINKYRLDNINLLEEQFEPDDLEVLLEKIKFLLRVNIIEKSKTTTEKIWFMTKVEQVMKEKGKN